MIGILKRIGALVALPMLLMTSVDGSALPLSGNSYVTIKGDRGGQVINYALRMMKLRDAGKSVKFAGRCDSACTLYLALPSRQVCVARGASFGFHLPYGASSGGNRIAANYLLSSYPSWVKAWIQNHGGLSGQIKTMSYAYASQYLSACPGSSQTSLVQDRRHLGRSLRNR